MVLFALSGLMDGEHRYKDAAQGLIRSRHGTLLRSMGLDAERRPNDVGYYALIDLADLGRVLYGAQFAAWIRCEKLATAYVFRLARETGVVLSEEQYEAIGACTRRVLDEYFQEFESQLTG